VSIAAHAGVHAQPARLQVGQPLVAQPVDPGRRSGAASTSARVSLRCRLRRRAPRPAGACRDCPAGRWRRCPGGQPAQHLQRLRAAVDQVTQHHDAVARRRKADRGQHLLSACAQPCRSPMRWIIGRFCYACAPFLQPLPPCGSAHGFHARRLPDPAQRPVRAVGDGPHGQPQGAACRSWWKAANPGRRRRWTCTRTRPSSCPRCRSASRPSVCSTASSAKRPSANRWRTGWCRAWAWPSGRRHRRHGLVVALITILTIVFGELVPKRLGQMYPETVARLVARPMNWLSTATRPAGGAAEPVHRGRAAPDGHSRRAVARGDGRRNRRQPGRGRGRRRDRSAGAPDGAQRLPAGRPPDRQHDDPAREIVWLDESDPLEVAAQVHRRQRPHALSRCAAARWTTCAAC
jgi:hypothetical protein